ncbi:LOW QUALITY PROTEIN: uncharacterized protein ACR2FA_004611 [Aphomia sociella]
MSKEGYSGKKEGDNKVVLERLQSYLKDKKSTESADLAVGYSKPSTSFEQSALTVPALEDSSNVLREVLNHKKAELLRQPEIVAYLKSVSSDLKK